MKAPSGRAPTVKDRRVFLGIFLAQRRVCAACASERQMPGRNDAMTAKHARAAEG